MTEAARMMSGFMGGLANWSVQVAVLAALVLLVHWAAGRRLAARWRHAMWLLVLARLAMPVAPPAPWGLAGISRELDLGRLLPAAAVSWRAARGQPAAGNEATPPAAAPAGATAARDAGEPAPATPLISAGPAAGPAHPQDPAASPWPPMPFGAQIALFALAGGWAAGAAAHLAWLVVTNLLFHRRLARLRPPAGPELEDLIQRCRREMGYRGPLEVLVTDAVDIPALFGPFRPRLLLPRGLLDRLSVEDARHVLRHELAHLKRRDVLVDWLAAILAVPHWFNPLVWVVRRRMRQDRELACDEMVLRSRRGADARAYGEAMIRLLEGLSRPARPTGVVAVAEGTAQVERRIRMIARFSTDRRGASLAGIALMLLLGAVGLTDGVGDPGAKAASTAAPPPPAMKAGEPTRAAEMAPASPAPASARGVAAAAATGRDGHAVPALRSEPAAMAARQLLVESRFLEVNEDLVDGLDARWEPIRQPAPVSPAVAILPTTAPVGSAEWTISRRMDIRCAVVEDGQVEAWLKRAATDKRTTTLSAPRLIVEEGQQATIFVGSDIPYTADQEAVTDASTGKTAYRPRTEYAHAGLELCLTGTLQGDPRQVTLLLEPKLSRVIGMAEIPHRGADGRKTGLKLTSPEVMTLSVRVMLTVPLGRTVVLRGLPAEGLREKGAAAKGQDVVVLVKPSLIAPPPPAPVGAGTPSTPKAGL